ncbi:MAG: rhodanese-like domain-containing protein [Clostridia bacterium]|nr:rhodanese-like domain-containing protein [Clostridia bacterium]
MDVRSPQEFAENRINGAINIPDYEILRKAKYTLPNRDGLIILYCQSGDRSRKAYFLLERLGYTNLYNLKGGLDNI